jgi:hypothetical protein
MAILDLAIVIPSGKDTVKIIPAVSKLSAERKDNYSMKKI